MKTNRFRETFPCFPKKDQLQFDKNIFCDNAEEFHTKPEFQDEREEKLQLWIMKYYNFFYLFSYLF